MSDNKNLLKITALLSKIIKKINKDDPTIAIIKLHGVIGKVGHNQGLTLDSLKSLDKINKIKNLKAIALLINSPGGSPVQSELIAKHIKFIRQKNKKKNLPIIAFCEDVAASGGYWLACIADEIYASRASIIGSIGVISHGFGFVEALKKLGIERRVYSQGKNKAVLDPFSNTKKEDVELISTIQKDIHEHFIDYVKESRGKKLKKDPDLFTGKFWSGSSAKKLGLIDELGYYEEVLTKKYGKKIKFKEFGQHKSFLQRKLGAFIDIFYGKIEQKFIESSYFNKYKL